MTALADRRIDPNDLVDAARYAARGSPHRPWGRRRPGPPAPWAPADHHRPLWAPTRHADIKYVSSHPELYRSAPRMNLMHTDLEAQFGGESPLRTLVNMDPPEHRAHRAVAAPFFKPAPLRSLEAHIRAITVALLGATPNDEPFDAVADLAAWHPLKGICGVLGSGIEDAPPVMRIANAVFGI